MKTIKLGKTGMDVPVLALGCMRLADADRKQAAEYFRTALDLGLNFFDHADIYAGGRSEEVFASRNAASCPARCTISRKSTSLSPSTAF